MPALLALLLSVTLSAPFGEASAELIGFTPEAVTVEITVEVLEPAALVLLRGQDVSGQELDPIALLARDDGTWGAVIELPARRDLVLAFDLIPGQGASILSEGAGLADLGIDPGLLSLGDPPPVPEEEDSSPVGLVWIIVAVAAAGLALILLAIWSRAGRTDEESPLDAT
jgi:hypothetical protein